MKSVLVVLAICFAFCSCQINTNCFPTCVPDANVTSCATISNTECRNIYAGSTINIKDYRCVCQVGYEPKCVNDTVNIGTVSLVCALKVDVSCGVDFPNGCPLETFCLLSSTGDKKCVCKNLDFVFTNAGCIPRCSDFSIYDRNLQRCACIDGYTMDPNTPLGALIIKCIPIIPANTTTCDNYPCPFATKCVLSTVSNLPICVVDDTVRKCGTDFRCPNDRFVCIDTQTGPVCKCSDRFAGTECDHIKCWSIDATGAVGCYFLNGYSTCTTDSISQEPYCVCNKGWSGLFCDQPDNLCANVVCSGTNTKCVDGGCRCADGYIPDQRPTTTSDWNTFNCVPANPPVCDNTTCSGNFKCVERDGKAICVCPFNQYGAADCNKPRCAIDADCTQILENSFCLTNTQDVVPPYCACQRGFTGARCNVSVTCATCGANRICNNEGRCKCAPGFTATGDSCIADASSCRETELFLRAASSGALTAEQVSIVITVLVKVDISNLKVAGPTETRDPQIFRYMVYFCSDENVNSNKSTNNFNTLIEQGNTGGLDVATAPSDPAASPSSASFIAISFALLVAAIASLL